MSGCRTPSGNVPGQNHFSLRGRRSNLVASAQDILSNHFAPVNLKVKNKNHSSGHAKILGFCCPDSTGCFETFFSLASGFRFFISAEFSKFLFFTFILPSFSFFFIIFLQRRAFFLGENYLYFYYVRHFYLGELILFFFFLWLSRSFLTSKVISELKEFM